ncbi:MAG: carboxypeptidase-like regulatory domain-containing protein, partial [Prolixibacteraceae bacterium]|jgi:hypothetical protein|nr:carboxypeptidase-like regulatory domain-containing protein [Prolixibacteraceae bacterium]
MKTLFFIILLMFLNATAGFSQDYFVIENFVRCEQTQEPIPYVSVGIKGTSIGAMTDLDGRFLLNKLPISLKTDTLYFSHVSFRDTSISIADIGATGIILSPREIMLDGVDVSPFGKTQNVDALVLLKKSLERIRGNYHPGFQNYVGRYQYVTTDEISADTVRHSKGESNVYLPSLVCSGNHRVHYDSLYFDVDKREESLSKFIDSEEERTMCMPFPYDLKYMLVYFSYMSIEYRLPFTKKNLKDYSFSISDTLELYDEQVVQVAFSPFEKGRRKYFGNIYLALSDYAIKKIEMHLLRDERNVARTIGLGLSFSTYNLTHSIYDVDIELTYARVANGKLIPDKITCRAAYNVTGNNNINSNRYISTFELGDFEYRHIVETVTPTNQDETPRINKRLMRRLERYIKKIGAPELLDELEERY